VELAVPSIVLSDSPNSAGCYCRARRVVTSPLSARAGLAPVVQISRSWSNAKLLTELAGAIATLHVTAGREGPEKGI
jgi:hypothetical protein